MRLVSTFAFVSILLLIAGLTLGDGMAACQSLHSFDVCHDSIH